MQRIRVQNGSVDFADLSLALPFGTRVHELKGSVVGLRSRTDTPAEVELDGAVDEYGLARVTGQLRPFDPAGLTDLKVVFRNVEMPTLTPYSATFAGRKIRSGRLSLDLEYKLRERQLEGDNRIVMDQLVLGDKVDSPDAVNLPLDLAVALLQDADGRIDLGLPVTGSLDDPQFSIGRIVWKAIVNLLTRIVTAPFRALGALLGGGEQTLDRIVFDAGASSLLPPEQEKLAKLADGLAQRPALALVVQGGFDTRADGAALRQRSLRRAVARQTGRTLAEGEDPGPIGLSEPAVQAALEALFVQRFSADALAALRRQLEAPAAAPSAAAPAPDGATPAPADRLHPALLQRLTESQPVDDAQLQALAGARAAAIRDALVARGLVAGRLALGEPKAQEGDDDGVPTTLTVDVAAAGAGAAAGAAVPPASAVPAALAPAGGQPAR